ncbi:MAG: type VI secretion system baseplate subunit TssF [Bryobacteraceae bacterium]
MRDELLYYYERELGFLRQMGADFAERYPKVASRLALEATRCDDPHVERIIEAFSFLAARLHLKIDDEFPEITQALLSLVYPHYLRPIPAMSVAEFRGDPKAGKIGSSIRVPRGSTIFTRPTGGVTCKFRSCYETIIWPLKITEAQWRTADRLDPPLKGTDAVGVIRLLLRCNPGITFNEFRVPTLRFYLYSDPNLVYPLYELLCNNCSGVLLRDPSVKGRQKTITLPGSSLRPVGFAEDESMLPYPRRSFSGYRLLQEYFAFPEKFLFVDFNGLDMLTGRGFGDTVELLFLISSIPRQDQEQVFQTGIAPGIFKLNCSPIVNLFPQTAEPILHDQTSYEYPVIADVRRRESVDVFSVDSVSAVSPRSHDPVPYEAFYSFRHGHARTRDQVFWHVSRRELEGKLAGTSPVWLSLVDLAGNPVRAEFETLTLHCTCTNGDLPSRLPLGNERGDFDLDGDATVKQIVALRKPTQSTPPPLGRNALWRLISHLSLNYLSLVDEGKDALQEILRLYEFSGSPWLERQIAGISKVNARRHLARVVSDTGISFVKGTRVEMELDEEQYVGGGAYLFASVMECFLGQYVSMNSFSQLVAKSTQREEIIRQWQPRAGQSILL